MEDEFKVGDRVRLVYDDDGHADGDGCDGPDEGAYGLVTEITSHDEDERQAARDGDSCGWIVVDFEGFGKWNTTDGHLAHAKPVAVTYKVGDRVVCVKRGDKIQSDATGPKVGDRGVVKATGQSHSCGDLVVRYDRPIAGSTERSWYCTAAHIKPDPEGAEEGETVAKTSENVAQELAAGGPVTIERGARTIALPDGMSYDAAIEWLNRRKVEDSREVRVFHEFEQVYPLDALVAFHRALATLYNWVDNVPTPGFFGDTPPTMISVWVSATASISVPWGLVQVPGISGKLGVSLNPKTHNLVLNGTVRQGSMPRVREIIEAAEARTKSDSIYRGKAVRVSWNWKREGEEFDPHRDSPHFMSLDGADAASIVFNAEVSKALKDGLFTPIEYSEACRQAGIPLKRGVLLEGPYGVGKTLTALVTAAKAVANGWTFVYLDSVEDLPEGLTLARQYAPAVVFAEDIDRVVSGERSLNMDEVLNHLDGVDTKHVEIITVLTTNFIKHMNKAILRPGRMDTVVNVRPPDAATAERLVALYGRGLIAPKANLTKIGKALDGKIPAVIREVVERAKISAVSRLNGQDIRGQVTEDDLAAATLALEAHAALLADEVRVKSERHITLPMRVIDSVPDGLAAN